MKCDRCVYRTCVGEGLKEYACFYIVIENKKRGCPPGDDCDKFKEGESITKLKRHRQSYKGLS